MILCSNPKAQYLAHRAAIDEAIGRVLDRGMYVLGEEVRQFEAEFARWVGVSHGIGVGNGTDALHVALVACGVQPGDEVVTVSHTATATVAAIELAGAVPVVVDVDPRSFAMRPELLEAAITERTRAIVPVHLYGHPADMPAIVDVARRRSLRVVEDCSQAHGATLDGRAVGTWGDAACFSFYPTKNLGAVGDGGMVVTSDDEVAGRVRALREYGWVERYVSSIPGWNTRLDEIQAAVLRVKLPELHRDNDRRRAVARRYDEELVGVGLPERAANVAHVYHLYVVRSASRDELRAHLVANGVAAQVHYPVPVHLQPAYRGRIRLGSDMSETERAAAEVLSLPIYPELDPESVGRVIGAVRGFSSTRSEAR